VSTRPLPPSAYAAREEASAIPLRESSVGEVLEFILDDTPTLPRLEQGKYQLRRKLYLLLLIGDLAAIYCAFALGSLLKFGDLEEQVWLRVSLAATPLFVGLAVHSKAYTIEALKNPSTSAGRAFGSLLTAFALLFVISYFLRVEQDVSRLSIAIGGLAGLVAIAAWRNLFGGWLNRRYAGKLSTTVVITDGVSMQPPEGAVVRDAAVVGLRPEPRNPEMLHRLATLIDGSDRVVVVCKLEACSSWAVLLKGVSVRGEIIPDEFPLVGAVGVEMLGPRTSFIVAAGPLTLQQRAVKRIFDLALTIPILVLIAPVLLGIAIAIKLESKGPVLFKQPRVGFGNKLFEVYKFRSMAASECDRLGIRSTERQDHRVTRVGRFIRATSLDELPQLFNVLLGTMSLVGPRPHALGSLAGPLPFWEVDDRYPHRHVLKPGITGLAQVRGFRGATDHVHDLRRRLQSDLEYIAGWSVWRDILIIGRTVRVIVHQKAY
jgi:exopolysaccharide biosynthesis polyprenyl glycosylphosphotransferase